MPTINLYDAKTQLSQLVDRAANGEEIIIAKAGRPLARLVPLGARPKGRQLGTPAGQVRDGEDCDYPPPESIPPSFLRVTAW